MLLVVVIRSARLSSVIWPLPAMQRKHQANGSQKQHPTSEAGAQHVSAAFFGGEQ